MQIHQRCLPPAVRAAASRGSLLGAFGQGDACLASTKAAPSSTVSVISTLGQNLGWLSSDSLTESLLPPALNIQELQFSQSTGVQARKVALTTPGDNIDRINPPFIHDAVHGAREHQFNQQYVESAEAGTINEPVLPEELNRFLNDSFIEDVTGLPCHEPCSSQHEPLARMTVHPTDTALSNQQRRKLSCRDASIEINHATVVDPATTISLPQTAFSTRSSVDGHLHTKVRTQLPNTIILSRQSVTDIRWLNTPNASTVTLRGSFDNPTELLVGHPEGGSTDASSSTINPPEAVYRLGDDRVNICDYTIRPPTETFETNDGQENERESSKTCSPISFKSFPALVVRQSTQDWLNPPSNMPLETESTSSLYHLGIDARSGHILPIPSVLVDEPIKPRHCNHRMFHEDIFECSASMPGSRRATEVDICTVTDARPERMGAAIGSSSRRRRGTIDGTSIPLSALHKNESSAPHLMDRIREGGRSITRRLSAVFQGAAVSKGTRAPAPSADSEGHSVDVQTSHGLGGRGSGGTEYLDPFVRRTVRGT